MKVENQPTQPLARKSAENAAAVEKYGRAAEGEARSEALGGKDQASLSERARLLARAHAALEETPDLRSARVDQLREQVQAGNYQVPVEALARSMLAQLKGLTS